MSKVPESLIKLIQKEIEGGFISRRKHPTLNYYILNYSTKTQINWRWNAATIVCRGLIVDDKWNIIARPFKKFFTFEQWRDLRNSVYNLYGVRYKNMFDGPFRVFDKLDGSLAILFHNHQTGQFEIATRGSFTSEQAIRATEILQKKYPSFLINVNPNLTYLFEIIYPENRIVVDYEGMEDLILLAVIDNDSGKEINLPYFPCLSNAYNIFPRVKQYDFENWDKLEGFNWSNREGFVVHFLENDIRLKIKFEEYKNIHRIVSTLSEKNILRLLTEEEDYGKIIEKLPPHIASEVENTILLLLHKFKGILTEATLLVNDAKVMSRKDFAIKYNASEYRDVRSVAFSILDNKDWKRAIWRIIEKEL